MDLQRHTLQGSRYVDLASALGERLHLLRVSGRGACVDVPAGWFSLWLPLAGHFRLQAQDSHWDLTRNGMQAWRGGWLQCETRSDGWWLGIAGPLPAWQRHLPASASADDIALLPMHGPTPRALIRRLVGLVRNAHGDATDGHDRRVGLLCTDVLDWQHDQRQRLSRCSGRTPERRLRTLLRLLHVQHLLRCHQDARLDLAQLAHATGYSPGYLKQVYRDVFDETPHEYANRLRNQRAWQLVRGTALPVHEITERLGFESQSAFCRSFKHSFGVTTTQARHGARESTSRAA